MDDSYTPTSIGIKAGTYFHDLVEVRRRELDSPKGWTHFALSPLTSDPNEESLVPGTLPPAIWTYHLQVNIYANHLNGKDTHLRGVRVFGPPTEARKAQAAKQRAQQEIQTELLARQEEQRRRKNSGGSVHKPVTKGDIRYQHAYRLLDGILSHDEDALRQHRCLEGEDETADAAVPPSAIDPAASAHQPSLPASSRDLFLTHSLR